MKILESSSLRRIVVGGGGGEGWARGFPKFFTANFFSTICERVFVPLPLEQNDPIRKHR